MSILSWSHRYMVAFFFLHDENKRGKNIEFSFFHYVERRFYGGFWTLNELDDSFYRFSFSAHAKRTATTEIFYFFFSLLFAIKWKNRVSWWRVFFYWRCIFLALHAVDLHSSVRWIFYKHLFFLFIHSFAISLNYMSCNEIKLGRMKQKKLCTQQQQQHTFNINYRVASFYGKWYWKLMKSRWKFISKKHR